MPSLSCLSIPVLVEVNKSFYTAIKTRKYKYNISFLMVKIMNVTFKKASEVKFLKLKFNI